MLDYVLRLQDIILCSIYKHYCTERELLAFREPATHMKINTCLCNA